MKKQFTCKPDGTGYGDLHKFLVDNEDKVMTYYAMEGVPKKRSLDSNALQAVWIAEVSEHTGESITHVRRTVKRDLGLDVLRYDTETPDEEKAAKMINYTLKAINYDNLTPGQQLNVMDMFNVTSVMSRRQHKKMLDQMVNHYADKLGLILVSNNA